MNVIFISPHFPYYYYNFCDRLKKRGVNVLGIGDTPYDNISQQTKDSLNEYYYVKSLENYDDVYKAVAFYISKYGRISWIESENEYWLMLEAHLRSDFNVNTGPKYEAMGPLRYKSKMKDVYKSANIPVAPYIVLTSLDQGLQFARDHGYPLVVKPDNGMGASDTHKLTSDEDFIDFYAHKQKDISYICEVCIPGRVETFEGITDSKGKILVCTSHVMVNQVMDNVNEQKDTLFYSQEVEGKDIYTVGNATVQAFKAYGRFFHFEFMRLEEDHPELGKKVDLLGLEVNMRAPGAYIPEMMNLCYDIDVYTIWADMILYDTCYYEIKRKHWVAYAGRRNSKGYAYRSQELYDLFRDNISFETDVPKALAEAMGDHIYVFRAASYDEMKNIADTILLPAGDRAKILARKEAEMREKEAEQLEKEAKEARERAIEARRIADSF